MRKIAIIPESALSKWKMQICVPLTKWFDITVVESTRPLNDIANIQFPIKKLFSPSQLISKLPLVLLLMFSYYGDI